MALCVSVQPVLLAARRLWQAAPVGLATCFQHHSGGQRSCPCCQARHAALALCALPDSIKAEASYNTSCDSLRLAKAQAS